MNLKPLMPFLIILFTCIIPIDGYAVGRTNIVSQQLLEQKMMENPDLSRADMEEILGRKLTMKEKLLVKVVQRKAKKAAKKSGGASGKLQIVALILCIFLGLFGAHRFYLGYTGLGILYIFTLGLFGIGFLIDLILLIIPNGLTPKGKTRYKDELY